MCALDPHRWTLVGIENLVREIDPSVRRVEIKERPGEGYITVIVWASWVSEITLGRDLQVVFDQGRPVDCLVDVAVVAPVDTPS